MGDLVVLGGDLGGRFGGLGGNLRILKMRAAVGVYL